MPKVTNIALVGVGGQGIILAGKLLAQAALQAGHAVKLSEIHGMAQRGGSVVTQVRFGSTVFAPTFGPGEADYVIAFERLEALRHLPALAPDGTLLLNDTLIQPITTATGKAAYPRDVLEQLQAKAPGFACFNAEYTAEKLGNSKVANVIMLGALSIYLEDIPDQAWAEALTQVIPERYLALNKEAFAVGRGLETKIPPKL